jgi:acetyltransferase-like isoleucine patch superfamily enzyme
LGEGVVLDSAQRGYHVAMWGPVRLLADKPGAVISLGAGTRMHGSGIHAEQSVRIGARCLIAANCQLFDSNGHVIAFDDPAKRLDTAGTPRPIVLEDDVWLGTGVIVLPGTHIGAGSVIAAGSVVGGVVPPRTLMRGNPAVPVERAVRREASTEVR